ncbi:rubredoxin [Hymenobacter coccineus]|uniref:rubredoxin n=1 Tax=Hymenobacter coccineus TaxID=1908235 RepID=UPI0013013B93|nr:rubredoxin [Hymenobacter coccineus]
MYDAAYGEPAQGIAPGTPFDALIGYECSTCGAPAALFEAVRTPHFQAAETTP